MIMFVLQSALLVAIAFVLGCVVGCLLRQWLAEPAPAGVAASMPTIEVRKSPEVTAAPSEPVKRSEPEPQAEQAEAPRSPEAVKSVTVASGKDDLKKIRGIGKQNEKRLNDAGISTFAQIAAWSAADQAGWGEKLAFPGRIEREDWVGQAKILAEGGETSFSKRVKKTKAPTSS
jgi:predicted flap endonuclease-1-like 5' DNA nuclease